MFVRGLPYGEDKRMRLVSRCSILQPCQICREIKLEYFVCVSDHAVCLDCHSQDTSAVALTTSELESLSADDTQDLCRVCENRGILAPMRVPLSFVERLEFTCRCGFRSVLPEVRAHVDSCDVREVRPDPAASFCSVEIPTPALVPRHKEETGCQHVSSTENLTFDVGGYRQQLPSRHTLFTFDFRDLERFRSLESRKLVSGVPLRVRLALPTFGENSRLSLYVNGSVIGTHRDCWPIKKRLIIRMLDSGGEVIWSSELKTYSDGKFASKGFKRPTQMVNSCGFPEFFTAEKLSDPGILVDECIRISLEVRPL